jgi:TonB family protein
MRATARLTAMLLVLALTAACDTRPTAEIDAAHAARTKAPPTAPQFAPESAKAAQEAQAALDAELAAQDAKWFKSYDRARELATAATLASEKATADAIAGKERADAAAAAAAAKSKADADMRARLTATAVRVGGAIPPPKKTKDVAPIYPALAKSNRIGGTVQVELTLGPDGKVVNTRVVKSVPVLDQAALDAVKDWEYTPTRVKGVAVPVKLVVGINFQP